ncbi:hypothetical protein RND71_001634 [Anisodus tanguticus]|uniref:Ribulose bisphosphate carboxylase large subunit C-terminal domain-containing protein n=1 Tax=Anisodus tanguticus TaxID=243964 RepID=A0AAE1T2S7_9SOLA|nr:hypothetical protein RND71_001634 [Anisodus tanguticus]
MLSVQDHIHSGTVVGKLEGDRDITLGFVDLLRDDFFEQDRSRDIYFTQDWEAAHDKTQKYNFTREFHSPDENVLAESRMMVPDCSKRLEAALEDLKGTLELLFQQS